jgi:hypothetical protein
MLEESEYASWNAEFLQAKTSIGPDRELQLERVADLIERELILVGATAVEDKLQTGVGMNGWLFSCYRMLLVLLFFFDLLCYLSFSIRFLNASIVWHKQVSKSGF